MAITWRVRWAMPTEVFMASQAAVGQNGLRAMAA
jgi:hypothetical protein